MFITVLLIVAAFVALVLIRAATRPPTFSYTRSAVIPAPPAAVHGHVNDFRQWETWSPWAKLDRAVKNSFAGPPSGVGAKFAWSGNSKVGEGRMTITESRPGELIQIDLEFLRPMKARNLTVFTFAPDAGGTRVTWTMSGNNLLPGKIFGLFVNMDKLIGGQFAQGLENLKRIACAKS